MACSKDLPRTWEGCKGGDRNANQLARTATMSQPHDMKRPEAPAVQEPTPYSGMAALVVVLAVIALFGYRVIDWHATADAGPSSKPAAQHK